MAREAGLPLRHADESAIAPTIAPFLTPDVRKYRPMATVVDEGVVRAGAQAFCDALTAGDVDRAMDAFSPELRRNAGEVLALLPMPTTESEIESVERSGAGYNVVLRLAGEANEDRVQTRWKDRDGRATLVEASHLSRTERAVPDATTDEAGDPGSAEDATS